MDKNIRKEILRKIKNEEVAMKPKWWFVLKESLLRGGWIVLFLTGVLLMSLTVYFVKRLNPTELWEFGSLGAEVFIQDFPYWFVAGVIIIFLSNVMLLSKIGENYKRNIRILGAWVAVLTIVLTIVFSLISR
jgi:hypothetical protein